LDIIRGVLKKAKRWHLFADEIKPLPLRQKVGKALGYEEKLKLLPRVVQSGRMRPGPPLSPSIQRGCEIKQLRWRDIDLMEKTLVVGKSKTEAGERVIPLNKDAWSTILLLYERSKKLGEVQPEHYVFPSCEASKVDRRSQ